MSKFKRWLLKWLGVEQKIAALTAKVIELSAKVNELSVQLTEQDVRARNRTAAEILEEWFNGDE